MLTLLLFTGSLSGSLPLAWGAPVASGNNGSHYVSTWQSEPNVRGTWTLITSCLSTMILCIWTAVHLNIPAVPAAPDDRPKWKRIWTHPYTRRTRWMLMALLAPELVVYTAWRQFETAKDLTRKVNGSRKKKGGVWKHEWTLVHSFFAILGGFCIDTAECPSGEYVPGSPRLHLTGPGIRELMRGDISLLPDLSIKELQDRSKADGLAKGIVCLQAGYLVVQCISRWKASLPVSTLEVNTLGHVLSALILYAFWFKKPFEVMEPVVLEGDWTRWFAGWSYQQDSSEVWRWAARQREWKGEEELKPQFEEIGRLNPEKSKSEKMEMLMETLPGKVLSKDLSRKTNLEEIEFHTDCAYDHPYQWTLEWIESGEDKLTDAQIRHRLGASELWEFVTVVHRYTQPTQIPGFCYQGPPMVYLDNVTMTRWEYAYEWLKSTNRLPISTNGSDGSLGQHHGLPPLGLERYLVAEVPNWVWRWSSRGELNLESKDFSRREVWPFIGVSVAASLYGGLHASAWNTHFPSTVEMWLWRASSLVIAFTGFLIVLFGLTGVVEFCRFGFSDWRDLKATLRWRKGEGDWVVFLRILARWLGIVGLVMPVVVSRVFLITEAFIGLRSVDPKLYITPNWTQWIPHL